MKKPVWKGLLGDCQAFPSLRGSYWLEHRPGVRRRDFVGQCSLLCNLREGAQPLSVSFPHLKWGLQVTGLL